ncbi:MAG: HEAT repeat domain-containing protein [Bacteroidales bacterium]|nr:HEAT repeat domain-containing protein [Bacteroidales bacterium]
MIRKLTVLLLLAVLSTGLRAQTVEKPSVEGKTSFAVIIDSHTLEKCAPQVAEYKKTIESEGLPTFIVSAKWESPEQVKEVLQKLYRENNLEGTVFIGDVPVAMVMKAQYMTSAYKMDERKYPLEVVAVPSDRFYDDFDLKFNKIADSTKGLHHFYELAPDSTPYIECDIYSARIRPQKSNGCGCKQIAAYLEKAVREHKANNKFDQFVSYTGHGSYSNSITAWRAERQIVNEQFGDVFKKDGEARYLRYSMEDYMKPYVIKELRRPDVDFMVFHEHGDWFRMYLSGAPEDQKPADYLHTYIRSMARRNLDRIKGRVEEWGLDSTWYADYKDPEAVKADSLRDLQEGIILEEINDIAPNARMVIFDACYNGDYRHDDFIAGKFIMAKGSCVVGFANSVNVLQDKSAFDLLGLLGDGVRVGLWSQHINILESHLIGDPTFHFAAEPGSEDLNKVIPIKDNAYWVTRLDDENPEIQNMAEIKLFEGDYPGISDILLNKLKESPYAIVRYNSLRLLEKIGDKNYWEALKLSVTDSFEYIRRIAVTRMGQVGAEEFLPYLISAYVKDIHATRVVFDATSSLLCFDKDKTEDAINEYFFDRRYYNADKDRGELLKLVGDNPGKSSIESITNKEKKSGWRVSYIQFLRNRPYHQNLDQCLKVMEDPDDDVFIRTLMAESLAWWTLSYRKQDIIDSCKKLLADSNTPEEMRPALISAVTRLSSRK